MNRIVRKSIAGEGGAKIQSAGYKRSMMLADGKSAILPYTPKGYGMAILAKSAIKQSDRDDLATPEYPMSANRDLNPPCGCQTRRRRNKLPGPKKSVNISPCSAPLETRCDVDFHLPTSPHEIFYLIVRSGATDLSISTNQPDRQACISQTSCRNRYRCFIAAGAAKANADIIQIYTTAVQVHAAVADQTCRESVGIGTQRKSTALMENQLRGIGGVTVR
jgi:hypothetical protein